MDVGEAAHRIRINPAPVLTLWAAVVADRLGFDRTDCLDARAGRGGLQRLFHGRQPRRVVASYSQNFGSGIILRDDPSITRSADTR